MTRSGHDPDTTGTSHRVALKRLRQAHKDGSLPHERGRLALRPRAKSVANPSSRRTRSASGPGLVTCQARDSGSQRRPGNSRTQSPSVAGLPTRTAAPRRRTGS